jgi:hypothetical protein
VVQLSRPIPSKPGNAGPGGGSPDASSTTLAPAWGSGPLSCRGRSAACASGSGA